MENQLINLKLTSKQLARMSKKAEKAEKIEKVKLKKAIEKGNLEGAKVHAQNAIRQKNLALSYLKLSSRVDSVYANVETAVRMQRVTQTMSKIVGVMDLSMQRMDLETMSKVMDDFEKNIENMDVQNKYMENSIDSTSILTTPQEEVDELIAMTADEYNINLKEKFPDAEIKAKEKEKVEEPVEQDDDLYERLAKLKSL